MPTDQALDEDPDWLHVDVERETFGRGEPGVRTRFGQTNTPDAEIDALPARLLRLQCVAKPPLTSIELLSQYFDRHDVVPSMPAPGEVHTAVAGARV